MHQHREASRTATQRANAAEMLTAMLDQETGLRGDALVRRATFLVPSMAGRDRIEVVTGEQTLSSDLDAQTSR